MYQQLKNIGHWGQALLANIMYGFPGRKITVIGVTGTDGKTTTISLIYHILKNSGRKVAMITTIGAYVSDLQYDTGFHVTTPSSFALQKFLRQAVNTGHEFAVIETSSHGIDQNRIWGIPYKVAAITNITHEHLDYHPNFKHYADTKIRFMKSAKSAVLNFDDPVIKSYAKEFKNKLTTYSLNGDADLNLQKFPFNTNLFGTFNLYNCLAAIGAARELGITDNEIRIALKTFEAPLGRQNIVYDKEFKVMVDFAHTPNSIETLLREARKTNPKRIIHLFGAPGRRDETKRPLMGQSSAKYADMIIIAPDDPRDEEISYVNNQIKQGVGDSFVLGQNLFEYHDRREAIKFALQQAQPGDFIILTGKGHEQTLALATGEMPWNESSIVKELLHIN